MSHVDEYRDIIKKQTDELCDFVAKQKAAGKSVDLPRGDNTDLRGYLAEYSYKWGITALIAGDMGQRKMEARFYKELEPYDDLQDLMD